ncbi:MAG: helix-turn-helix domain-containing protein [Bacteroidales bacterium]|nr:helix-turn-helix domain-containing protein [Bacteroidales bacterium]
MEETFKTQLTRIENLLTQQTALQKQVLNFKEAAAYMGLSTSYLYKLTSARKIVHFCPEGKMLFFNRLHLDQWLQRNRQATVSEIESNAIYNAKRNKVK